MPGPRSTGGTLDVVTLNLIRGALDSASQELGLLIERTSMSPFINEKHDYLIGFANAVGRYVSLRSSFLVGTNLVRPVREHYPLEDMRPGDLYWLNDAYRSQGAISHLPDLAFVAPAFVEGRLLGFAASYAHFWDIGGLRPGSLSPDATEVFQEGIMIPPVRVMREGTWNDELVRLFLQNSRFPTMLRGDIGAMTAAARLGEVRLAELAERFGLDTLLESFDVMLAGNRDAVETEVHRTIHDGTHVRFADATAVDPSTGQPSSIRLVLTRSGDRLEIDTRESTDQAPGPVNLLMHPTIPTMFLATSLMRHDPSFRLNAGASDIVDRVEIRQGSILAPHFPAPIGNRGMTLRRVGEAVLGLMAQLSDGNSPASSAIYDLYVLRSYDDSTGETALVTDGLGVGCGAKPIGDGADAIYGPSQQNFPCEFMELNYPLRFERYGINTDSGGAGRYRGGCGIVREFTFLGSRGELALRLSNASVAAWGVKGGHGANPGAEMAVVNPGTSRERRLKPFSDGNQLEYGDVVRICTAGGGGWGDPFDREPDLVCEDVANGFVSLQGALDEYGVVIDADTMTVDLQATQRRREQPGSTAMFHRGTYLDELW
jgi:N-methylhydantoinase B